MRTVDGRRGERGRYSRAGGWTRLRADQLWGWVCKGLGERPLGAKVLRLPRIPWGRSFDLAPRALGQVTSPFWASASLSIKLG